MQAIKDQVKAESLWDKSDENAENVARGIADAALKQAHIQRQRGGTQSDIYNKTVDHLMDTGCTFELAKVAAGWAVTRMAVRLWPASL